jgi:hypothetical protein
LGVIFPMRIIRDFPWSIGIFTVRVAQALSAPMMSFAFAWIVNFLLFPILS